MTQDPAVSAAMQILLGAGEARKLVGDAIELMVALDFDGALAQLAGAQAALRTAHQVHTDVIQAEASGTAVTFPALFSHAQDTMMTTDGEIRMVRRLVAAFKGVDARLAAIESAMSRTTAATTGEGAR
ncbi:PTS lactose/cellobiose transporter subunit IIA [Cellulomonas sp. KRMCY2]|uniref:PTS lactose/cellobiose transporter subunit IIA n=1 Tax=Cellulomonas sp. KRMCY2 TaxID=1304865 RepID=UPI00045EB5E8|nr:PTS lactose/cellobiose transporter subunit IIA [Cellulomonas sp. KRMCY2]